MIYFYIKVMNEEEDLKKFYVKNFIQLIYKGN